MKTGSQPRLLIMPSKQQVAEERKIINQAIRTFFEEHGSLEVETPLVVRAPGMEPNLTPFETVVSEPDGTTHQAALITSPEYAMKKLLGQGFEQIFTITKVFRNVESLGGEHNPEFSMLEWYQQGADYHACMDETEALIRFVADALGKEVGPIERVQVRELFLEHVGIDLNEGGIQQLQQACAAHKIHTAIDDTESDLFYRLFLELIEPTCKERNLFVYDYPLYQAALSAVTEDGNYGQRFELYLNGLELCNGFTELTDSAEQRRRFEEELKERESLKKKCFPIDEELLRLLGSIRNPTYGNALGIDRLHMHLTGRDRIEDVLLFPSRTLFTD